MAIFSTKDQKFKVKNNFKFTKYDLWKILFEKQNQKRSHFSEIFKSHLFQVPSVHFGRNFGRRCFWRYYGGVTRLREYCGGITELDVEVGYGMATLV